MGKVMAVVLAFAASGCVLVFDDVDDSPPVVDPPPQPPPQPPAVRETAKVVPLMCSIGTGGDPGCPINILSVDARATFSFVARPIQNSIVFDELVFRAGAEGLYIEHPVVRFRYTLTSTPTDHALDAIINVPPLGTYELDSANLSATTRIDTVSLVFTVIGPHRP